MLESNDTSPY